MYSLRIFQPGQDRSRRPATALAVAAMLVSCLALPAPAVLAQTPATLHVRVVADGGPVAGATVSSATVLALTDSLGIASLRLPAGDRTLIVSRIGYASDSLRVRLRAGADTSVFVHLSAAAEVLAPIVVTAARLERRVEDQPERVEVLAPEDVQEKTFTSPAGLSNLLVEMGGIRIERAAPGVGGAEVRVQGLPGRYTLFLADGLPLYGARAPTLGLVQLPPLDLRQVEVLKGAASALYGPTAASGVVDLISKRPSDERVVLATGSSRDGQDGLLWLSRRLSPRWGYTFLGGAHRQDLEDPDADGWADLPGYRRLEARPRLFWNGRAGGSLLLTAGGLWETRRGGTSAVVSPGFGAFRERLDTRHADAGANGTFPLSHGLSLGVRASAMRTTHERSVEPAFADGGRGGTDRIGTAYAEATLRARSGTHEPLFGVSAQRDGARYDAGRIDYGYVSESVFAGDTWSPHGAAGAISLSATARVDHHDRYGTFLSPRASILWHPITGWSVRASGAAGFFAPSPVPPDVEILDLHRFRVPTSLRAERVRSASLDVGGAFGPLHIDGTAFLTRIAHPSMLMPLAGADSADFTLVSSPGPLRTGGIETFAYYSREPWLVTLTWSHTRATELAQETGRRVAVPLTPLNAGGVDAAWEEDEAGARVAIELFYTGRQRVEADPYRTWTPGYATLEVLASKRFGTTTVFISGEDLTNVRQTDWDPLLLPTPGLGGRRTTEEWAPLEGRILRVGTQVRF